MSAILVSSDLIIALDGASLLGFSDLVELLRVGRKDLADLWGTVQHGQKHVEHILARLGVENRIPSP
jgi:hypothetical protein